MQELVFVISQKIIFKTQSSQTPIEIKISEHKISFLELDNHHHNFSLTLLNL